MSVAYTEEEEEDGCLCAKCELSLSLSRKPAQPEEPSSTWAVIVALLPRNLLYFVASQLL